MIISYVFMYNSYVKVIFYMKKPKTLSLEEEVIKKMEMICTQEGLSYSDLISSMIIAHGSNTEGHMPEGNYLIPEGYYRCSTDCVKRLRELMPATISDEQVINTAMFSTIAYREKIQANPGRNPGAPMHQVMKANGFKPKIVTEVEDVESQISVDYSESQDSSDYEPIA